MAGPGEAKNNLQEKRRGRGPVIVLSVAFMALVLFVPVRLTLAKRQTSSQINRHLKELAASKTPLTWTEIAETYRRNVTNSDNAAAAYQKAFDLLVEPKAFRKYATTNRYSESINIAEETRVGELLEKNKAAYAQLSECLAHPYAYYDLEWEQGLETLLRHLPELADLQSLLELDAGRSIREQIAARAVSDIERLVKTSDSLAEEPTIASCQVRMRGHGLAQRIVEALLNNGRIEEAELLRLANLFRNLNVTKQFKSGLDAERRMLSDIFEGSDGRIAAFLDQVPYEEGRALGFLRFAINWMRLDGALVGDHLFFLQNVRALNEAADLGDAARFQAVKKIDQIVQEDRDHVVARAKSLATHPQLKIISGMALPGLVRSFGKMLQHDLDMRLTEAAIAAKRFEARHKRWPETIDDLTPEFSDKALVNPFTGEGIDLETVNGDLRISGEWQEVAPKKSEQDDEEQEPKAKVRTLTLRRASAN